MSGNAIHRFTDTAILGVCAIDAPEVVTSEDFDARLADTYERVGLRPGMLRSLVGIKERRWWP
ncbi:MAG: 3-oxoacyl-ACP synthase III, partial [Actinomycetota bacterium]|nr:3-oxoacyl-ACP synthase III [Actinomycetota bacterium]